MKHFYLVIFFLSLISFAFSQEEQKPTWTVKWDQGLKVDRSDGKIKIQSGGRIQFDVMSIWQNPSLSQEFDAQNGAEFRRLRWYTSGTLYGNIKFKLQFDFSAGDAGVKDAYIQMIKIPVVGNLRVGHFKQPFGLEMQSSSKYIEFMERGLTNIFTPERDLGFMIFNTQFNKRLAWFAGYFYPTESVGKYVGDQYRYTLRLAGQPVYKPEGTYTVLHLGAAFEHQFQHDQSLTFAERPEAHLAPKYVNLTIDAVDEVNVFGAEFAFVRGPFALQSEYMIASVLPSDTSSSQFTIYNYFAVYGLFSWFITGEHRNYNQSAACFDRLNPKKNFGKGGAGAWELAIRLSHVDLNDHDLKGGSMTDFTFGVNWYLNPATRVTFNYIYSNVLYTGYANIAMIRFYVNF
jgi:phosphate-selective porin OprO and OprP